jgi:hypothetical protein
MYRKTVAQIDGRRATIGNNGDIVEVMGKTAAGLVLRNARGHALCFSSENRASRAATSPARTECFDILLPEPVDTDVTSQIERLNSKEMKMAARSLWIVVGASARSATLGMVVSRVGGLATSLCQSVGCYPSPHRIFQAG